MKRLALLLALCAPCAGFAGTVVHYIAGPIANNFARAFKER